MKRLFYLAIPALLVSCGPKDYTINGSTTEAVEGQQAYLKNSNGETVDSCTVAHCAFSFTGTVKDKEQDIYTICIEEMQAPLFIQNGVSIIADMTADPAKVTDKGGLNDDFASLEKDIIEKGNAINAKSRKLLTEGKSFDEVRDSLEQDVEALYDIYRNAITKNKDNIMGAQLLCTVASEFYPTLEKLDSIIAEVKYAKDIKKLNDYREILVASEATKEGKEFVDFAGLSVDGTASKLSDYVGKGKFVLVDFWASWCGPCRGEIPNLVELQAKLGGEKFTVLGVNVWDDENNFKAALEREGITYPQIYIPRDNEDNATQLYGINGIPQIILFAPDGTIVKRNLRGEEMKNFVSEQVR